MPGLPSSTDQPASDTKSLWIQTASGPRYEPLTRNSSADAAVLGGGITGLMTAWLLAGEGLDVILIDQSRVGTGVTGYTTAKLSSLHQLTYARLASRYGSDSARVYGEANQAGLAQIAALTDELPIECDFRRRPNYTYAATADELADVEREVEAAREAGLPASFIADVPLPFETHGAVRFDDQAEFHPYKFTLGLARALAERGVQIHEQTRALRISDGSPCEVLTTGGRITTTHVVIATGFPFTDRALFFARQHAERSYCVAAQIPGSAVPGMFISAKAPTRSLRWHPVSGEELLLVGGEGHKVGQGGVTAERYRTLEQFAREHFEAGAAAYRWSSQDNMPADGLPFIGRLTPRSRHAYVATGYRKWGLAMGASAARIISDSIVGRENPWAELFDPNRLNLLKAARDLVSENANVGFHFFADRLTQRARASADDLAPGEGKVVSQHGRQIAVAKSANGVTHAVSARCTHLGCIVSFNDAERTWDCPCHGGRFTIEGAVLQGPPVKPLGAVKLASKERSSVQ